MKFWLPKAYRNWLARQQRLRELDQRAWDTHRLIRKDDHFVCNLCHGDCGQCGNGGHAGRYERERREILFTSTK